MARIGSKCLEKLKVKQKNKTFGQPDANILFSTAIYRCDVVNSGYLSLLDTSIKFDIPFGDVSPKNPAQYRVSHTVYINPFRQGDTFSFYVINESKLSAMFVIPDNAIVQVLGEDVRRSVPLKRLFRSQIEFLVHLMPSYFDWGKPPL